MRQRPRYSQRANFALLILVVTLLGACADPATAPSRHALRPSRSTGTSIGSVVPNRYIVRLRDSLADVAAIAPVFAASHHCTLGRLYSHALKGFVIELPDSIATQLARDTSVLVVEPDRIGTIADVEYNAPWGLDRIDQRSLPLGGSFGYTYTGAGVRIYIIDSGIRLTHQDFGGRAVTGKDYVTPGGSATDCVGHGTHVAGIAGGATYGVAKGATLVSMRVLDCSGSGPVSYAIAALDDIAQQKQASPSTPMVANISLHYGYQSSLNAAVDGASSAGVEVVVAAANDSKDACLDSPSSASSATTVAASDANDRFAWFSNWGRCVALIAPGVGITSDYYTSDGGTAVMDGTSMASPHVAGVAAAYLQANPSANYAVVRQTLTGNATQNAVTGVPAGTPNLLLFSNVASVSLSTTPGGAAGPVTATASVAGATGSYYYQWRFSWCYAGTAPHDCDSGSYVDVGGWDKTSLTEQMRQNDKWIRFTVTILTAPGGQALSSDSKELTGPWVPPCGGGNLC